MKIRGIDLLAALGLCAMVASASAPARAAAVSGPGVPVAVALGPGSELWLEGKSTVHDYESRTRELTISFVRDSAARQPADLDDFEKLVRSSGIRGVDVHVPVSSLRSGKAGLDKNLWKALKADEHPVIRFHLANYTIVPNPAAGDTVVIRATGLLEVAGNERPDTLDARAYPNGNGLWLVGSEALRMSDFGIRPPTMMLGTLRVADPIIVRYRLLLVPGGAGSGSPSTPGH